MTNLGMVVPYAYRSLPGLKGGGLGITDARVTRILSGGGLAGPNTIRNAFWASGLASLAAAGTGAYIGSRRSRGWAAGGAMIGMVASGLIGSLIVSNMVQKEAMQMEQEMGV